MGRMTPGSGQAEYFAIAFVMRAGFVRSVASPRGLDGEGRCWRRTVAALDQGASKDTALVCHSFGGFVGVHGCTAFVAPDWVCECVGGVPSNETVAGLKASMKKRTSWWQAGAGALCFRGGGG
jgi:hypothetical protein